MSSTHSGCITAFNNTGNGEEVPQNSAQQREEPAEVVLPVVIPCNEPQKQVCTQGHPDLPTNGVFIIAQEICELKSLLDFLEEHLNSPTALIELTDADWRPVEVATLPKKTTPGTCSGSDV